MKSVKTNILWLLPALLSVSCGGISPAQSFRRDASVQSGVADGHHAANALDYFGIYKGTLPGADCPGIATTLTLAADGTYALRMEYLGREVVFDESGRFEVEGNILTLKPEGGARGGCCKIEIEGDEGRLRMLDGERKPED